MSSKNIEKVTKTLKSKEVLDGNFREKIEELAALNDKEAEKALTEKEKLKRVKLIKDIGELHQSLSDIIRNISNDIINTNLDIIKKEKNDLLLCTVEKDGKEIENPITEDDYYIPELESTIMYFSPLLELIGFFGFDNLVAGKFSVLLSEQNEIKNYHAEISTKGEALTEGESLEVFKFINHFAFPFSFAVNIVGEEGEQRRTWIENKVEADIKNGKLQLIETPYDITLECEYLPKEITEDEFSLNCAAKVSTMCGNKEDLKEEDKKNYNILIEALKKCYPYAEFEDYSSGYGPKTLH